MKIVIEEAGSTFSVSAQFVPKNKTSDLLQDLRILIKNNFENE